jgi:cysteine synthase A
MTTASHRKPCAPIATAVDPLRADSPLDLIGRTPLVRLTRITGDDVAEVWAKCEQYNPGGSVKDRIALSMIEAAEAAGHIEPGRSTIVEPTSGNTGIGLALVCAAKGYKLVLTMPESMSLERRALLESYGAELVMTAPERVMEGAVERARELASRPDCFMPDQFRNPANPAVHERTTGPEIVEQLGGAPHALVSAIGTGGTITGVGRVFRRARPDCRIVGVEPARSAVLSGDPPGPHKIQGIGAGFVPDILDRDLVTEIRTVLDIDAYRMKGRLAREEGLLVGISSGANVEVAARLAAELGPGHRVVTILCDTGERYFSLDEYFEQREAKP